MKKYACFLSLVFVFTIISRCGASDWPQFHGPNRDGKSAETGLLKQWPAEGPEMVWSYEGLGDGFSTVTVVDGLVYVNGVAKGSKTGTLFAFDLDGNLKWKKDYGPEWAGRTRGCHTPPTYNDGKLYHMSGMCVVSCMDAKTGDVIWSVDTVKKFHAENLKWGLAEAPLIDGNKVICTPGGKDATMVALDKNTGETIWTTKGLSELSAYCSSQLIESNGRRLVLTIVAQSIIFVDVETGQVVLRIEHTVKYNISAVSPVFKDGLLYVTNGYGHGGIMYEIAKDFSDYEMKWTDKTLDNRHEGVVLLDGYIYGSGSNSNYLVCLELATGKVRYSEKDMGKNSILFADGMLYCYAEKKGVLSLVKATSDGFERVSSFNIPMGTDQHWAHPVISDGRLYMRHGNALIVYNVKDGQK